MEITEVKIKLVQSNRDRLHAFCSITFDRAFVVRDLKIIEGQRGLFVAMPSRKLTVKCSHCRFKSEVRARFCSQCGKPMPVQKTEQKTRLFADIAHPINAACREKIQTAVLEALEREKILANEPGYVCTYDEYDELVCDFN